MLNEYPTILPHVAEFISRDHTLFIGGEWQAAGSDERIDVLDPGLGKVLTTTAQATDVDVDAAVAAARSAFTSGPWAAMSGAERGQLIWKLAERLEELTEEFAQLESLDNGKPLVYSRNIDLPETIARFRYMAGWAGKVNGETVGLSTPGEFHAYTLRQPTGVVGQIIPWNFPIIMAAYKLAPALAAGCTVVLKPAEQTPLTALRLIELIDEVGFPPGVVNLLTGDGRTGRAMVAHRGIDKIAFTGSTAVGKEIVRSAADDLKRVSIELGGKSPVIIMPDADIAAAAKGAAQAVFFNQGQLCTAGSRAFIHRSIYDKIISGMLDWMSEATIGHGMDEQTTLGPLVSQEQLDRVQGYIDTATAEGATMVRAEKDTATEGSGYFLEPVIATGVSTDMTIYREEIFGPVLCAIPFDDADDLDALAEMANDTEFGLAASIWTRDVSTVHRLASRIKAGTVWVNTHNHFDPALAFGGVKESGWGRESGLAALELYTEVKAVLIPLT
jgi:phenylacetaldehyde dehydrogenase